MRTALDLTKEERKRYIEAFKKRPPLLEPTFSGMKEREELLKRVHESARILKTKYGARRVILFGSLAYGAWFVSESDVDLAVEGLKDDDYWEAWSMVEELITDRVVDIVQLENVKESLRKEIQQYGVEL